MKEINGKIKDMEGNIIEDDIPIWIEIEKNQKTGRKRWYGLFNSKKIFHGQYGTQALKIELEDGRCGQIYIHRERLPSMEKEFTGNGALE